MSRKGKVMNDFLCLRIGKPQMLYLYLTDLRRLLRLALFRHFQQRTDSLPGNLCLMYRIKKLRCSRCLRGKPGKAGQKGGKHGNVKCGPANAQYISSTKI